MQSQLPTFRRNQIQAQKLCQRSRPDKLERGSAYCYNYCADKASKDYKKENGYQETTTAAGFVPEFYIPLTMASFAR